MLASVILFTPLDLFRRFVLQRAAVDLFATAIAEGGSWSTVPYTWQGQSTTYLTTNITSIDEINRTSAIFPLRFDGGANYSISLNTPGCTQDNSCSMRGRINVTSNLVAPNCFGHSSAPFSVLVEQTNNADKYDQIYYGLVSGVNDAFEPAITLAPASGNASLPFNIVAQAVRLTRLSAADITCDATSNNSSVPQTSSTATDSPGSGSGLSSGAKAGIAVGIVVAVVAAIAAVLLLWWRKKRQDRVHRDEAWPGKPELAADEVQKHEHIAEIDGPNVQEMVGVSHPQELEAEVPRVELGASDQPSQGRDSGIRHEPS